MYSVTVTIVMAIAFAHSSHAAMAAQQPAMPPLPPPPPPGIEIIAVEICWCQKSKRNTFPFFFSKECCQCNRQTFRFQSMAI